jgi:hypothetical protein
MAQALRSQAAETGSGSLPDVRTSTQAMPPAPATEPPIAIRRPPEDRRSAEPVERRCDFPWESRDPIDGDGGLAAMPAPFCMGPLLHGNGIGSTGRGRIRCTPAFSPSRGRPKRNRRPVARTADRFGYPDDAISR